MRIVSLLVFIVLFTLIFSKSFAQAPLIAVGVDKVDAPESSNVGTPLKHTRSGIAQRGTYQIMHIKGMPEETVPESLISSIETYRSDDRMIYMKAGENTWIKILPYNIILSPDFKPVPNDVYTDESLSDN